MSHLGAGAVCAHVRDNNGLLADLERRALVWIAERMPRRINSDHLSALGLSAMLGSGLSFAAFVLTPWAAWGVVLSLALNWFGDSLDGTLARVRRIQRPRYGFYLDHLTDAYSTTVLGLGLGFSPYMLLAVALAGVAAYLVLSINVYLETYIFGVFRYGYGVLGPTEARILLIVLNLAALFVSPLPFTLVGVRMTAFDVGGIIVTFVMIALLLRRAFRNLDELAKAEPPNVVKD
jgi:archaetidylinositol phosphate synthase